MGLRASRSACAGLLRVDAPWGRRRVALHQPVEGLGWLQSRYNWNVGHLLKLLCGLEQRFEAGRYVSVSGHRDEVDAVECSRVADLLDEVAGDGDPGVAVGF